MTNLENMQRLSLYQECVVPEDIHIPMEGNRIPRGGGVQKEAISEGVGGYLQRLFPSGSE